MKNVFNTNVLLMMIVPTTKHVSIRSVAILVETFFVEIELTVKQKLTELCVSVLWACKGIHLYPAKK